MTVLTQSDIDRQLLAGKKRRKRNEALMAILFLLPSLVGLIGLKLFPMLISLYISLTDWVYTKGLGNWNFIGFKNFSQLWTDEWFIASLKNTLVFTVVTVPIGIFLSLVIASLIDQFCHEKVAGVVRVALYMPHVCNTVAISSVWMALYSSYGPFTNLMRALGWENPPRWIADQFWALPAVMLVVVWAGLGYRVFIYSASMQALPTDIYECASLDGANGVQKFFYLTIPLLTNTTFFLTVTGIISSFQVFGYVNVMTQGGPMHATYVLVFYIYRQAFHYYNTGYASAISVILFLILLVVTTIQYIHNNKKEGY